MSPLRGFDKIQQVSKNNITLCGSIIYQKVYATILNTKIENGESRLRGDTKKSPNAFDIWALIYVISLFENRDPRLRGDTNKAIFLLGNSVLPWLQ